MKKCLIIVVALMVLWCYMGNALGEEFTIRNGLKWGATPDMVLEAESIKSFDSEDPTKDDTFQVKVINKAKVAGYMAEADFGFKNGKLASIEYILLYSGFPNILEALIEKYGDAYSYYQVVNTSIYKDAEKMYKQRLGGFVSATLMNRLDYWWVLDNGTIIVACSTNMYGSSPYIAYIYPSAFKSELDFSGI